MFFENNLWKKTKFHNLPILLSIRYRSKCMLPAQLTKKLSKKCRKKVGLTVKSSQYNAVHFISIVVLKFEIFFFLAPLNRKLTSIFPPLTIFLHCSSPLRAQNGVKCDAEKRIRALITPAARISEAAQRSSLLLLFLLLSHLESDQFSEYSSMPLLQGSGIVICGFEPFEALIAWSATWPNIL